MATTRCNIALVICILLVFILMEGAKPAYGKKAKGLNKRVAKLEKNVNEIEDKLKCKPCLSIEKLMKRLTDIEADIEELTKSPTTLPPPPSPTTPSIPECQNYKSLSTPDRKTTYDYKHLDLVHNCDSHLGPGWFRFEGDAGTQMPTFCPPTHRCNTKTPGWLKGTHPEVAEGQVTRQVCFHWNSDCCKWSTNIQVRNCGSYYVYHFSGTPSNFCRLRYCGTD